MYIFYEKFDIDPFTGCDSITPSIMMPTPSMKTSATADFDLAMDFPWKMYNEEKITVCTMMGEWEKNAMATK